MSRPSTGAVRAASRFTPSRRPSGSVPAVWVALDAVYAAEESVERVDGLRGEGSPARDALRDRRFAELEARRAEWRRALDRVDRLTMTLVDHVRGELAVLAGARLRGSA